MNDLSNLLFLYLGIGVVYAVFAVVVHIINKQPFFVSDVFRVVIIVFAWPLSAAFGIAEILPAGIRAFFKRRLW